MSKNTTSPRHGAPRPRRWFGRVSRPACGLIPPLPDPLPYEVVDADLGEVELADRPSMELPGEHMAQRPYDTVVLDAVTVTTVPGAAIGYWRPRPVRTLDDYRVGDEVTVTVEGDDHTGRKAWVEALAPYKPSRQVGVRVLTDLGGLARLIEWYDVTELEPEPSRDAATLTMPAVDEDDMVLMGGAR